MVKFPFLAPTSYLAKIDPYDPLDPLLKQVKIIPEEEKVDPNYSEDPLGETNYSPLPGVLHKYSDRILLLISDLCSIHCRFCFRRHLTYSLPNLKETINYISRHSEIREVILSGGDPFSLETDYLNQWLTELEKVSHLESIRFHSRRVIVDPNFLLNWYQPKKRLILVTHCNHPKELSSDNRLLIEKFKQQNYLLFNQSVLLKGVNDQFFILRELFQKLFNFGISPYYLHILDKVQGAKHFAVSKTKSRTLYQQLQKNLPGYLLPKLVVETSDGKKIV